MYIYRISHLSWDHNSYLYFSHEKKLSREELRDIMNKSIQYILENFKEFDGQTLEEFVQIEGKKRRRSIDMLHIEEYLIDILEEKYGFKNIEIEQEWETYTFHDFFEEGLSDNFTDDHKELSDYLNNKTDILKDIDLAEDSATMNS